MLICVSVLQFAAHREMYSILILIFNFEVFKMGFKWGMTVLLVWAPISICKLKFQNENGDPKWEC